MEKNHLKINQKVKNIVQEKTILFLIIICLVGLIIRFHYVPYGIPLTQDAFLGYFLYALDISILGHLPNYTLSQSGWSEFLSIFFTFFYSDNLIDYHDLQRTVSVLISGITVIPIYFICKKFFNNYYSLIGATIFAFEPRIILNSTLGISEPLYILAISLGILLFFNCNKKIIYSSFGFFAWATIIRPEGQFWFVAISIAYFLRFRKSHKDLMMFLICLSIFLLVLSPVVVHRIQCCENDGIIGRILAELRIYEIKAIESNVDTNLISYGPNFTNGIKLFGWSLIPIFMILVPLGLIPIFKNLKFPEFLLIVIPSVLAIPIMYSVSIAPDTRYIYPIYPIFIVISLFGIRFLANKIDKKILFLWVIVFGIIVTSMVFLDFKKIDYSNDEEAYAISKLVFDKTEGVNKSTAVVGFFKVIEIENRWPITESKGRLSDSIEINRISVKNYNSLEQFIESGRESGLTHLIIDDSKNMPDFFVDVFDNENRYQFLDKEFDSIEYGYNYHVKKFKINYDVFQNNIK